MASLRLSCLISLAKPMAKNAEEMRAAKRTRAGSIGGRELRLG